jgi:hypothetical protein
MVWFFKAFKQRGLIDQRTAGAAGGNYGEL